MPPHASSMSEQPALQLVVLISGEGSNFQAIQNAIEAGSLNAHIGLVLSNKPEANGLNRARSAGIDQRAIPASRGQTRESYDQQLIDAITPYKPDLIVLAGFMRILSPLFIRTFPGKIINIHPSLLPAYKGLNTHQRVLDAGEQYHGATVHYVNEQLDAGEIIIQSRISVRQEDDAASLQQRIHHEEHLIYPRAIQWIQDQKKPN